MELYVKRKKKKKEGFSLRTGIAVIAVRPSVNTCGKSRQLREWSPEEEKNSLDACSLEILV
jgi:hypothetical protein